MQMVLGDLGGKMLYMTAIWPLARGRNDAGWRVNLETEHTRTTAGLELEASPRLFQSDVLDKLESGK